MRTPAKQYKFPQRECKYERFESRVESEDAARAVVNRKSDLTRLKNGVVRRVVL